MTLADAVMALSTAAGIVGGMSAGFFTMQAHPEHAWLYLGGWLVGGLAAGATAGLALTEALWRARRAPSTRRTPAAKAENRG